MPQELHAIEQPDGWTSANTDRAILGVKTGIAHAAAGAGVSVATVVALPAGQLPAAFTAIVIPDGDYTWWLSARSPASITVNLSPRLAASAIGVGTFDLVLVA